MMETKPATKRAHFLIVEDNELFGRTLRDKLRPWGEASLARDYCEALSAARGAAYSAVFVDVWLPGGSGLDVLAELRRLHTPAMALTGYFEQADSVTACALGAQYVVKPISMLALHAFTAQAASLEKPPVGSSGTIAERLQDIAKLYGLTPAECDLIDACLHGLSRKEYVDVRALSVNTYKARARRALRKLGACSLGEVRDRLLRSL
jgi:DNA-binding NarL/FixJ family response regulator